MAKDSACILGLARSDEKQFDALKSEATSESPVEPIRASYLDPPTKPGAVGRIGHYEVLEVIARGGFGIVLKAFDDVLHRVVAIKMMSAEMAATSPARQRFLREARAAAGIRHESVVQIYAVEEKPIPYLVMEYIPGKTLQELLDERGPLDIETVLRIGSQVARGLAAAHNMGLVHRDIKPGNIMVENGPELRAKLTDFGLARAADDASLTQSGVVAGTPMYMAPEQARGENVDPRTDLFSLGSVLYVMASGRPPFRAPTSLAVLKRVNEETPRPIREIVPEVPQWLCDIISKLHEKDAAQRFQSTCEVADILSDCLAQMQRQGKLSDNRRIPAANNSSTYRRGLLLAGSMFALAIVIAIFSSTKVLGTRASMTDADALPATYRNALNMDFVLVGKGSFRMGGGAGKSGGNLMTIPHDFYLGVYEVTQEEWIALMGKDNNPSHYSRTGSESAEVSNVTDTDLRRFPVDSISWEQCQEFIRRLNAATKETGWKYRLPTAAEWEYACRGGPLQSKEDDEFDYYLSTPSNVLKTSQANFKESGLDRTCKVGSYLPNRLGLFDMHGNVFEYCDDISGEGSELRALRGGCWHDDADTCRVANRNYGTANAGYNGAGLRLARVPVVK